MVVRSTAFCLTALLVCFSSVAEAKKKKDPKRRPEDLINYSLGIEYTQWLNGPTFYVATEAERAEFLALTSDEAAEAFVENFWKTRDPEAGFFGNKVKDLYDERLELADRRYREAAVTGRRTDRGVIYVLFGEPDLIEYDSTSNPREPDLEIWNYSRDSEPGLGGKKPDRRYYFAKGDGRTELYTPRADRLRSMRQQ